MPRLTVPTAFVLCLQFLNVLALAQNKSPIKPPPAPDLPRPTSFECHFAEGPIKLDGKADESDWSAAEVIEFSVPWPDARPARTETKARLLWDREHLYFFAEMEDSDLYADVKEHDGQTWDNDVFELFFKPADDKPGYYEFQVSAAGTMLDVFMPRRGAGGFNRFKRADEFHLEAKVELRGTLNKWQDKDRGWSVEGRLPWRDFLKTGGRPNPEEKWKFALCRYDYSVDIDGPELSTCAPLTRPNFHRFEDYASLRFVGPKPKNAARPFGADKLLPVASRVIGSPDPPPAYRVVRAYPNLKLSFPINVVNEPGSKRLIFIDQTYAYGPSRIARTTDNPASGEFETLLKQEGVAYSFAFHPKFADNGFLYIGMNGPLNGKGKKTQIKRFRIGREPPFEFDLKSEKLILEWDSDGHNGGAMAFGLDGLFYITSGDGTSDSDTNLTGQGLNHLLAKVLRIDVDHPDGDRPYSVPKDNPFVGQPDVRPETWAYGFRNPWRMTVDPKTGHLWVGNNGQDLWEQVYLVERGANYGWSVQEGSHPFYLTRKPGPTPISKPTFEHSHSESRSLTGGVVYYGQKLPELRGAYLYGDHSTGKIWAGKVEGGRVLWNKELVDTTLGITAFAIDSDGELLIADHRGSEQGGFYHLERSDPQTARDPQAFPRRLSESGLFRSVKGHVVEPGLIPYSVNSPLWSDGATKSRYLMLPTTTVNDKGQAEPTRIDFPSSRGWKLPNQTVLVKSFALEMQPGNPASRRWIETRFLTRQDNEWFGYSYAWNDDQTEALLVANEGQDRSFDIRSPNGQHKQTWHYPSRTECMVCHSRAANFVLGLSALQMNKDHDYDGVTDNQLHVLESLGLLRVNWHGEVTSAMRDELKAKGLTEKEVSDRLQQLTGTRDQREAPSSPLLAMNPNQLAKLPDPYDARQPLDQRARSYLHANCSICHIAAGGGNAAMELEFTVARDKVNIFDVAPLHHKFDLPDARLIAPGHPERSVLLHRVAMRGAGQMPQLATALVDSEAVKLLRDWIAQMSEKKAE